MANEIKQAVKLQCGIPRHKIIVQLVVGQNDGQGVRVASKCLWDTNCDNWTSVTLNMVEQQHMYTYTYIFSD